MRFLFLLLDFIIFFTTTAFVITIRSNNSWNLLFFLDNCKVMFPIFILNIILLLIFSFYDFKSYYKRTNNHFIELSISFIVSFVFSATGIYFGANIFDIPTPKTNLLLILLIFYAYVFISRSIYHNLNLSKIKILTLGTSRTLNRIKKTLDKSLNYKIVSNIEKINEISNIQNISNFDFDLVLISNNILEQDKNISNIIFDKFVSKGITCVTDLDFFEHLFSRLPKETLRNTYLLIKDINREQVNIIHSIIKRIFDICFSLILIPILFPIGILVYFLILIIDKQSPIFFQERVGFQGKVIQIYKFRTLIVGTENPTKVGKILRKFRLDEIPQLINILNGDISIVGPRPLWTKESKFLSQYIYVHNLRNLVKPGLTGWSQLNFKAPPVYAVLNTPKFENESEQNEYFKDAYVRLAYDIWYVKNTSIMLDIEIMFKTAKRAFIKDKNLNN